MKKNIKIKLLVIVGFFGVFVSFGVLGSGVVQNVVITELNNSISQSSSFEAVNVSNEDSSTQSENENATVAQDNIVGHETNIQTISQSEVPELKDQNGSKVMISESTETHVEDVQFSPKKYQTMFDPNDTFYPQWYSTKIEAPSAWDISQGTSNTVVAVLDTGFALNHVEFAGRWWSNTGENGQTQVGGHCWTGTAQNKSNNGCDDDNNGYIDDYRGWDFAYSDNSPQAGEVYTFYGAAAHGTSVAGLIGATGNNSIGIAGLNWNAKIMPLQVLGDDGVGDTLTVTNAINYAVAMGANVINMSFGGPEYDPLLDVAIQYAISRGVTLVASAGNCGSSSTGSCSGYDYLGQVSYPGRFVNVITAAASTSSDTWATFSSYGNEVDVMAPGSLIDRTTTWSVGNPTNDYRQFASGTSYSAPILSGVASLVLGVNPYIKPNDMLTILTASADKLPEMLGANYTTKHGYGRVNLKKALLSAKLKDRFDQTNSDLLNEEDYTLPVAISAFGETSPMLFGQTAYLGCRSINNVSCTMTLTNTTTNTVTTLSSQKSITAGYSVWSVSGLAVGNYVVRPHDGKNAGKTTTFTVQ